MTENDPRVERLPKWAQDALRDKDREIARQRRVISRLEAAGVAKQMADRYSGSEEYPTMDGIAFTNRNVVGTLPIGGGGTYDFLRWQIDEGYGSLRGIKTVSLHYAGNGRLAIMPHASNAINLAVVVDR